VPRSAPGTFSQNALLKGTSIVHAALLSISLALAMQVASDAPLADQVKAQVARLNADALADRTDAEQSLIKLGPAALDHLPEVTDRTPPETAQRLARIRQTLEQAQVDETGKPSLVTLIGDDLPLADVIARISQQTGNKISDYREQFGEEAPESRVSLNLDKVEFWPAIDQVLDKSQLSVYDFAGERGVFLVNCPPGQIPRKTQACYAGPFRLEGTRFESLRELRKPEGQSLKLFVNIAWEPRLRPVAIRQPLSEIKAVGTGDVAIEVVGAEGEPEASVADESSSAELQIPLQLPPRGVEKITSLKGKLRVLVPGPMQQFRFEKLPILGDDPKANAKVAKVEQRKAGVTVIVDQVRKNNEIWEVRTRVRFDNAGDSLESHRSWMFRNELYLVGADKKRIVPGGYEQTRQTDNEVGVAYLFELPKGPAGMTFVYETPTTVFELPVEYELRDLELP
jgi:hypothetical protein